MKNIPSKRLLAYVQQAAFFDFFSLEVRNYLNPEEIFALQTLLVQEQNPSKAVDFVYKKIPNIAALLVEKEKQELKKYTKYL